MTRSCPDASAYWPIPEPHDAATVHLADGGIIVLRRHGNPDGPRLVLSHGSSFSADAYFPFWSRLLSRFDLVVYDLRNHGRNPLGDLAGHHMPMMVWDNLRVVRAIDRYFGRKPKVGIYHSRSAAVAVYQAVEESTFAALVLFDPPVCPPGLPGARQERIRAMGPRMAERSRMRQEFFEQWEELADSFRRAKAFERMAPEGIDLLARTTLRPRTGEEGFELCCPPEYEAKLFEQLYKWAVAFDLTELEFPIKVIGGDPVEPFSFLPTIDPDLVLRVDYDFVPETTHLLQLEGNRLVLAWRLGLSRVCGVEDEPIGGCLSAEDRSPILLQGFEPDALHRQGRLAVHVELAAALGLSDTQPVGRLIARSEKARALTERLEQNRA